MSSSKLTSIQWSFGFSDCRSNPIEHLKRLSGTLAHLYSLRVGDYRLICKIDGASFVIIALHVGHRRHIYKS